MQLEPFVHTWWGLSVDPAPTHWLDWFTVLEPLTHDGALLDDGDNRVWANVQRAEMHDIGDVWIFGTEECGGRWGVRTADDTLADPTVVFEDSCEAAGDVVPFSLLIRILLVRTSLHRAKSTWSGGRPGPSQPHPLGDRMAAEVAAHGVPMAGNAMSEAHFGTYYIGERFVAEVNQGRVWVAIAGPVPPTLQAAFDACSA
ncbi:MAG: hypothetical protein AB8H79_22265 [Myxococcota bacterium]